MSGTRTQLFRMAFAALDKTGANRLLRARAQGLGVILTLHHVRRFAGHDFAPNRLLEIEPDFLDLTLTRARELGFDFVSLEEAWRRVTSGVSVRPFLHLTFDDGYRDVRDNALLLLEKHGAPATLYIASGFADHDADLWWLALEETIRGADILTARLDGADVDLRTGTTAEKNAAWAEIYWKLRKGGEAEMRAEIRRLAEGQGIDVGAFARALCMDWSELAEVAKNPLLTIGAHTVTHPMLAKHSEDFARAEMDGSRAAIAAKLGAEPTHFAYPVGDLSAAGPRDYALAATLGFRTAVTTRPGHLNKAHAATPTALPRVSLNGHFQTRGAVDALLSGTPFWAMQALRSRGSAAA